MRLRVGHQQYQFWPILTHFLQYYSVFPRVISTTDEPRGAFICRSSTLAVFSMLARFMDYYSPFWGPGAISMIDGPRVALMCCSSTIAVLADSSPFPGLLLSFGATERFPRLTNPEVRLCVVINNTSVFDFRLFPGLLLTILES